MTRLAAHRQNENGERFATLAELVKTLAVRAERTALYAFRGDRLELISYRELADAIDRGARALHSRGVDRDRSVLLWAPNSPEWIEAYFAVVCAGATAIPIDNQSTLATVAAVIEHANPCLLLTTVANLTALQAYGRVPDVLLLDAEDGEPRAFRGSTAPDDIRLPEIEPGQVASLLYTSGTTGTPKAVPLTHGNLAANASALLAAGLIGNDDRVLLPLPLHHTYPFTAGLLNALGAGAGIVLPAGISGPELSRAASETHATALLAVPRLCAALRDSVVAAATNRGPWSRRALAVLLAISTAVRRATGVRLGKWLFREVHARLGRELKLIGCGGAKLEPELARTLEGFGWTVLTGYGLTETSPVLTFNDWRHARLDSEGRPVEGVELRIRAAAGQKEGEILARGPNVFAGYWNNPEETARAFTPDGWFRTGDLGWLDGRGRLHVVGRSKELIVLPDGKKVFPETVEKIYSQSPLVQEIAVLEHAGHLAALIVPNEQAVRERGALREAALLHESLEDLSVRLLSPYQRVAEFRVSRAPLPRTQLGKLKRHLLPALYDGAARGGATPSATLAEEDRHLLESERARKVWEWLRQRYSDRPLSLDTSPQLDLQIDSLEWVAVTMDIEQRFDVQLTGEAVSRVLTLRDLLREIEAAAPASRAIRASNDTPVPLGPAWRAMGAVLYLVARLLMRVAFRLDVRGIEHLPPDGPIVITPNHASYLDPLAIAAALPWRRLRATYWAGWAGVMFQGPLTRFVSKATQVFPVDPDRDLAAAIRTARALLQQGHSIVWFPEGRRSPTGALGPFQAGVALLLETGAAVAVPAAIRGTFEAWPKHRRWPRLCRIEITFGEPVAVGADLEQSRVSLEDAVRGLLAGGSANSPSREAQ
jgi:long-chain acyl-CoA synthetase